MRYEYAYATTLCFAVTLEVCGAFSSSVIAVSTPISGARLDDRRLEAADVCVSGRLPLQSSHNMHARAIANTQVDMNHNTYQQQLYDDLMQLCDGDDAFTFKDVVVSEKKHRLRIFNYRRASYSDFVKQGALNCRGTMFSMLDDDQPRQLVSLPMEKFFNLNENPFSSDLDLSTVKRAENKADGSLISTYICNDDELSLKTRFSIASKQCQAAMEWLEKRPEFKLELHSIAQKGYTVNMEWCSPSNQIVLVYPKADLVVLNIRNHATGAYVDVKELDDEFDSTLTTYEIKKRWVEQYSVPDWETWITEQVPGQKGIEGYVLQFESGQRVKLKTKWYSALHHGRGHVSNPKLVFDSVVDGLSDDLRSKYYCDDKTVADMVDKFEQIAIPMYNEMVQAATDFYESNKHLDTKDYMVKARRELLKQHFGAAATMYRGKEYDFKKAMKSRWEEVKDVLLA